MSEQSIDLQATCKSSEAAVVEEVNRLARDLYQMHGEVVSDTYKFYEAKTELGARCWTAAVVAYMNSASEMSGVEIEIVDSELFGIRSLTDRFSLSVKQL